MTILNIDKLIKIKYHEKIQSARFSIDKENNIKSLDWLSGDSFIINEETLEANNCYVEDGNVFYYPSLIFYSNDGSTETKYFKTKELAKEMVSKIKLEPNFKTLTID